MTVIPATKTLKVNPHQQFHFFGQAHTADEHGHLHGVPHDQAVILIKNGTAQEHVAEAAAEAANEAPAEAPVEKKKKPKAEDQAE